MPSLFFFFFSFFFSSVTRAKARTHMQRTTLLILFTIAYIAIDFAYVVLSNKTYGPYVKAISGKEPNLKRVWAQALLAYSIMAIGWVFVCLPLAATYLKNKDSAKARFLAGAAAGALYGFVLYGVFNFTTGSMFEAWGWPIMIRDVAWGSGSLAIITGVAMIYL